MLNKSLNWLSGHRFINLLILLVYFLIVVLPHEEVGIWISNIFKPYTRDFYNHVLMLCASGGLLVYLFVCYRAVNKPIPRLLLGYLLLNLILAILCFKVLFVVNVEAIHFLQYAVFALLCYPMINNYNLTLVYTTIASAIDEGYQFYYLAPERTMYYDFNDVIINLIGAVFGLILIRSLRRGYKKYTFVDFISSIHFKIFLGLLIIIIGLFASGLLVKIYDPQDTYAKFWLIRQQAFGFWQERPRFNFRYHIVQPWEGVLIVAILLVLYSRLYKGAPVLDQT